MASGYPSAPSALGKPDMSGWDPVDVTAWEQCSSYGVLDEFVSPVEWMTAQKKNKTQRKSIKRSQRVHNDVVIKRARAKLLQVRLLSDDMPASHPCAAHHTSYAHLPHPFLADLRSKHNGGECDDRGGAWA